MMQKTSIALGTFDGLHIGHQNVLQSALSSADDGLSAFVLLFDVHPQQVLSGKKPPVLLEETERNALLREMGFSLYTVSFASMQDLSAERFVREILFDRLHAGSVSCGQNYHFGKGGTADVQTLTALCSPFGIRVQICETAMFEGKPVSSTRIRKAIEDGEVDKAAEMLSRPFSIHGEVIHGNAQGRELGYPTANQKLPADLVVPRFGVYASQAVIDGKRYRSMTNIGIRPTLTDDSCGSETHILDYHDDLYGKKITVELMRYIRPERKFPNLQAVFAQVQKDIQTAYGAVNS